MSLTTMRSPLTRRGWPIALVVLAAACAPAGPEPAPFGFIDWRRFDSTDSVVPNDNRRPAGRMRDDTLRVSLAARAARWRPDLAVDSAVTVQAFAAEDGVPRIPGPFIRAEEGTTISVTITNALGDSALTIHGLRAGAGPGDTIQIPARGTRTVSFVAARPGTYYYWGARSDRPINRRWGRDSQLTGAIVIDPKGARVDPRERIFVITLIDFDSAAPRRPPTTEDIFEPAINGRSWPYTERITAGVGDTVRWRWINATDRVHPMHLHGFHFRLTAAGTWFSDTAYADGAQPDVVTRAAFPGQTFAMRWIPSRPGYWLMHCHMAAHMSPYPERPDAARAHDAHDYTRHPLGSMAGLVMGIRVDGREAAQAAPAASSTRARRLIVGERRGAPRSLVPRGLVIQRDADPAPDSVEVPGTPLILRRGERAVITVVNRMATPTSIHWHGMELEGRYDGVAGWSGTDRARAPLVMPSDSFTVAFTPPRAGTFIYHAHMEEEPQLVAGVYGPMIVLEPEETFDPERDRMLTFGSIAIDGKPHSAVNGSPRPAPMELTAGMTYRLRVININPNEPVQIALTGAPAAPWQMVAKDGADLPAAMRRPVPGITRMGVGETYDFQWTPPAPGDATIIGLIGPVFAPRDTLRLTLRVR